MTFTASRRFLFPPMSWQSHEYARPTFLLQSFFALAVTAGWKNLESTEHGSGNCRLDNLCPFLMAKNIRQTSCINNPWKETEHRCPGYGESGSNSLPSILGFESRGTGIGQHHPRHGRPQLRRVSSSMLQKTEGFEPLNRSTSFMR